MGSEFSEGGRYQNPTGVRWWIDGRGKSLDGDDMTNSPKGDFLGKRKVMWREC